MDVFETTKKLTKGPDIPPQIGIVPISDIHLGAAGCDIKFLKNTVNWIRETPNVFVFGLGDYCDCIPIGDKRFDIKAVDPTFIKDLDNIAYAQMDALIDILRPIRDRILCMIPGNHEDKLRTRYSVDVMKHLKKELGVTTGDYMTYFRLRFDRSQYRVSPVVFWLQHGWFSGRKLGGKINQLADAASNYEADVYISGHSHDLFATTSEKLCLRDRGTDTVKVKKIFVNSGTFMNTTTMHGTSYSEQKAYPVAKIGTVRIDITPKNPMNDIHVRI